MSVYCRQNQSTVSCEISVQFCTFSREATNKVAIAEWWCSVECVARGTNKNLIRGWSQYRHLTHHTTNIFIDQVICLCIAPHHRHQPIEWRACNHVLWHHPCHIIRVLLDWQQCAVVCSAGRQPLTLSPYWLNDEHVTSTRDDGSITDEVWTLSSSPCM